MNELEQALAIQTPPAPDTSMMYDLPPLAVDGIPTPLDKMTQVLCILYTGNIQVSSILSGAI